MPWWSMVTFMESFEGAGGGTVGGASVTGEL